MIRLHDLRHSLRSLLRAPAFALAAVLTLGIGIGANSALFSVIDAVLLRPLAYDRPEELVQVFETFSQRDERRSGASSAEFLTWRERNEVFAAIGATVNRPANLTGTGEPEQLSMALVSIDLLPLLGIEPSLGRAFGRDEEESGHDGVAILSDGFWRRRFGADRGVVGREIVLDGRPVTIVGVLPAGATLLQGFDIAVPFGFTGKDRENRGHHYIDVIARLRPGLTLEKAQAGMDALAEALNAARTAGTNPHYVSLSPLHEEVVGGARPALRMLLGAVGFVLLIACANVAGLLLSRAATRERDLAIRAALGASRSRLAGHLLGEALVLALTGGALGLLLSVWGVDLLTRFIPDGLPRATSIGIDAKVFGFTAVVTILSGLLVGLVPALHFGKTMPQAALQAGGRGLTEGKHRQRLRGLLVSAEIALTLVLLVGASLLMRSFLTLRALDPGFASEGRLVAGLILPEAKYPDAQRIAPFYEALEERLLAMPGVEAAGLVNVLPLSGSNASSNYSIDGEDSATSDARPNANRRSVSPGYFRALGMHLVKGRAFTDRDNAIAPPVAIINEAM
ncbi:MAG TPA: ABC transporter permease, partial [Candidatus Cryosericum sp.]|nr:ABC transporter permease [Candidatus Cryosericum sp.]